MKTTTPYKRGPRDPERTAEICRLYTEDMLSCIEIGERFGIKRDSVAEILCRILDFANERFNPFRPDHGSTPAGLQRAASRHSRRDCCVA